MRMWLVDPSLLCDKHLLGEHLEMHMFAGTIKKKVSLNGYIKNGLVDLRLINQRHDALVKEMVSRDINHKSPLEYIEPIEEGNVNVEENLKELCKRCPSCRRRIMKDKTLE